jgi:hypothetical protein
MHHSPSTPPVAISSSETEHPPEPSRLGRRAATGALLGLGLITLASIALAVQALPRTWRKLAEDVVRRAHDLSQALADHRLSPAAWQDAMAELMRGVDAEDLARSIDLDALLAQVPAVDRGAAVLPIQLFPEGVTPHPEFGTRLFVFKKGRANPPHAHDSMVSMHYVLRGSFRARHFDRVRDEPEHLVLRPTLDRTLRSGDATSVSDQRDNVHWHVAETDGILLDVVRAGLSASVPTTTRFVDPVRADKLAEGLLRAPCIGSVEEALARFG